MTNPPSSFILALGTCLVLCLTAGAQDESDGDPSVTILISPTYSTLQAGQSLQLTASIWGTNDTTVNWLVNGTQGGDSADGTVSPDGLYTAPTTVPDGPVTITAQSADVWSASANATVTVVAAIAAGQTVSVSILPAGASLQVNQVEQFSATVSGTTDTAVNWLVDGIPGGNSAVGTITTSGVYTAPAEVPSIPVLVTAQSDSQVAASASAAISITPASVSVSISPTNSSVAVGQSQQFSASVYGASNTAVNWLVSGVLGGNSSVGTISQDGLYDAPVSIPSTPVTVTAQCALYPRCSASTSVIVTQPGSHSVTLSWTGTTSSVVGYYIYRGAQSSGPFSRVNDSPDPATTYTDDSVVSGETYYYAIKAVDSSGTESEYSNVAQALIP
jgi:hypothetical protein